MMTGQNNMNIGVTQSDRAVGLWLFILCGFIALMVLVGGLTRLTDSGLSITEWKPIMGAIPPLNAQDWQIAFEKYKAIPEYVLVNQGFSMAEFKVIFWWEWGHRQLGRVIGLVFLLPFVWFALRQQIPNGYMKPLLVLFFLGGLQAFMGWYMVRSGLGALTGADEQLVDVSQYRLASHLGLALIIFCYSFWLALSLWRGRAQVPVSGRGVAFAGIILILVLVQSLMGALVAGLDAGKTYTDWPLMDGQFIPDGLFDLQPVALNFFENYITVQFDHRMGAYLLLALVFIHWFRLRQARSKNTHTALYLALGVSLQAAMGITALMLAVPIFWGAAHQLGAVLVLCLGLTHLHNLRHAK